MYCAASRRRGALLLSRMPTTATSDRYTKQINDGHGHARYGGEEFVILLPGTPPDAALVRMEALRREIADTPIDLGDGQTLRLDFSAGIAGTPDDVEATTPKALLTCADARLLAAKRAGRGRCIGSEWSEEGRASAAPVGRDAAS